jgi:orotate phosphoribosyltransferase
MLSQLVLKRMRMLTIGTAIRESVTLINASSGTFAGVIVALDRQEKGPSDDSSAIDAVKKEFGVPVVSIVALEHVLEYLKTDTAFSQYLPLMNEYRVKYGA